MIGGKGNDDFYWEYRTDLNDRQGNDYANGNSGDDTFGWINGAFIIDCGKGNDWVSSDAYSSTLISGSTINGGSGKDSLNGGGNDDLIHGGKGVDFISGGKGNDTLFGGSQRDDISGGEGSDVFVASKGPDEINDFNPREDMISGFNSPTIKRSRGVWTYIRETIQGEKHAMWLYRLSDDDFQYLENNLDLILI